MRTENGESGTAFWQLMPRLLGRVCRCRPGAGNVPVSPETPADDPLGLSEADAADLIRRATRLVLDRYRGPFWLSVPAQLARYAGVGTHHDLRASNVLSDDRVLRVLVPIEPLDHGSGAPRPGCRSDWSTHALSNLLVHWKRVARLRTDEAPEQAIRAAGSVTRAARATRWSIMHDSPDVSRSLVAVFAADWLGRKPNAKTIDHVGDAILFADLGHDDSTTADELRRGAQLSMQRERLLTDAPFRGRRVSSLEQTAEFHAQSNKPVGGSTSVPPDVVVERRLGAFDERVGRVLAQLRRDELEVAQTWAADDTLTWAEAAAACGRASMFGVRVQRKLRRLGRQFDARTNAALPPPA
ncbi:hypothetical protein H4696_008817 [Amycolatopsis lexingtonensis]|uniref:Uncharacterized protein n=1 Tax=Amycolatopsis lexingtonensis TaxID=218822 RepID=A0ABR9IEV9_9PSEU|nr:hypothetical protein [Amycolatopsis lexingtonensis]MBE1501717.1 hypothetical protein [Amycolatopsis lexingtonensis]